MPDDIRTDQPPASSGTRAEPAPPPKPEKPALREVGPESEVRGGPEADAEDDLDAGASS